MQRAGNYTPSNSKTILDRVLYLSKQIHQTAQFATQSKDECHKIDTKIAEIINYLQYMQASSPTSETLKTKINDFEDIVSSCLDFVQKCSNANKYNENTYNTLKKRLNDYISSLQSYADEKNQLYGGQRKQMSFHQPMVLPMGPCANGRCSPQPMFVPMNPCANGRCSPQPMFVPASPCANGRCSPQPMFVPVSPCANGRCSPQPMFMPMSPCANGNCAR